MLTQAYPNGAVDTSSMKSVIKSIVILTVTKEAVIAHRGVWLCLQAEKNYSGTE